MIGTLSMDRLPSACRVRRNTHLADVTPFDFYRQTVYLPFIDYVIRDLKERFTGQSALAMKLSKFLPVYLASNEVSFDEVKECAALYSEVLPGSMDSLELEFEVWQHRWMEADNAPRNVADAIDACDAEILPNMRALLQIFASLPVSSCEAERSFSVLKLLKSYLRSRMGEERLSSLALLYIHSDISINIDEVITRFAQKNRRLKFE